jgi:hypothetical protein
MQLLWRRPLHQAVHAYVDGYTAVGEPLMLSVKRNWDGNACRYSVYLLYWYKSTNTDAATECLPAAQVIERRRGAVSTLPPVRP